MIVTALHLLANHYDRLNLLTKIVTKSESTAAGLQRSRLRRCRPIRRSAAFSSGRQSIIMPLAAATRSVSIVTFGVSIDVVIAAAGGWGRRT